MDAGTFRHHVSISRCASWSIAAMLTRLQECCSADHWQCAVNAASSGETKNEVGPSPICLEPNGLFLDAVPLTDLQPEIHRTPGKTNAGLGVLTEQLDDPNGSRHLDAISCLLLVQPQIFKLQLSAGC